MGLLAVSGLIPVGVLSATRALVDGLAYGLGSGAFTTALLGPLLGLALLFALDFLLVPWVAYLQGSVNEKLTARVHLLLMEKAAGLPDLTPFEDAGFYDELQVLRDQAPYQPLNLLVFSVTLFAGALPWPGCFLAVYPGPLLPFAAAPGHPAPGTAHLPAAEGGMGGHALRGSGGPADALLCRGAAEPGGGQGGAAFWPVALLSRALPRGLL